MKHITLYLIIVSLLLLFFGNTNMTLKPFSIKVERPLLAVGILIYMTGLCMIMYSFFQDGRAKGRKEVIKRIEQLIKDK